MINNSPNLNKIRSKFNNDLNELDLNMDFIENICNNKSILNMNELITKYNFFLYEFLDDFAKYQKKHQRLYLYL